MASISFVDVDKRFPDGTEAVSRLSLDVADGEFLVLVGPSGSGKTTALRMVAGLEEMSAGDILIGGDVVNDVPPKSRDIAMVFQNYALYPHMTVAANMGFALKLHGLPKKATRARVQETAEMLGIADLLNRKPSQLSGGQRQRVAMGRAIVRQPQAFLMDEPLSNLDAKLRVDMRAYISMLHRRLRTTTLYVTHDQTEAMTMGDRVAVMRAGRLEQVASPQELYHRPRNLFVASFIGSPAMNFILVDLEADGDGLFVRIGGTKLAVDRPGLESRVGQELILGLRPEDIEDARFSRGETAILEAVVALAEPLGAETIAHVEVDARPLRHRGSVTEARDVEGEIGDVGLPHAPGRGALLTARLHARSEAAAGMALRLAILPQRLHFFDPVTEHAIA